MYNDNRPALARLFRLLGLPESELPRTLVPGTATTANTYALVYSIYPYVLAAAEVEGAMRGADVEAMFAPLFTTSMNSPAVRAWFNDELTPRWPEGSSESVPRYLWSFDRAARAAGVTPANAGVAVEAFAMQSVFGGDDAFRASATSSTQTAAEVLAAIASGGEVESAPIALPETRISAPRADATAWMYLVIGLGITSVGLIAWGLWYYQRRYGRMPWEKRR
jgi:hypothetical protein